MRLFPPHVPASLAHLHSFISCPCRLLRFSVHSLRGTRPEGPCTEACCLRPGCSVFPALQPCSRLCSHVSPWTLSCPTKFSTETVQSPIPSHPSSLVAYLHVLIESPTPCCLMPVQTVGRDFSALSFLNPPRMLLLSSSARNILVITATTCQNPP